MIEQILGFAIILGLLAWLIAVIYDDYKYQQWIRPQLKRIAKMHEAIDEERRNWEPKEPNFNPGQWISSSKHAIKYGMVFHDGDGMLVLPEVMQELNLKQGQIVTFEVFMKILTLNANLNIAYCRAALDEQKESTK